MCAKNKATGIGFFNTKKIKKNKTKTLVTTKFNKGKKIQV
jgi:hypothetical protein